MKVGENSYLDAMEEYGIYNVDLGTGLGHEQSGQRPAIIVKVIDPLHLCIVIPLTSNLKHLNLPYTLKIAKTSYTNLKEDSVALIFQLRCIDSLRLEEKIIGKLEEEQVQKIKVLMKDMLAL